VGERVPDDRRRLLEAFGYSRTKATATWSNKAAGRAISEETVISWSLDELRDWLTKGAAHAGAKP
jgi:hypothetical protein